MCIHIRLAFLLEEIVWLVSPEFVNLVEKSKNVLDIKCVYSPSKHLWLSHSNGPWYLLQFFLLKTGRSTLARAF